MGGATPAMQTNVRYLGCNCGVTGRESPFYLGIIMRLFELTEGYSIQRPIDRERYTDIPGLEGPFMAKNGKVYYYDAQEGKYYDRDTDMYLSDEEMFAMNEGELDEAKRKRPKLVATGNKTDSFDNRDRNFVSKHQGMNRAAAHPDKKNDYKRKPKHAPKY
jgi:hypothetical protein